MYKVERQVKALAVRLVVTVMVMTVVARRWNEIPRYNSALHTLIYLTAREIIFLNCHLSWSVVSPFISPNRKPTSVSPPDEPCRAVSFALAEPDLHPLPGWPSKLKSQEEQKERGENHSTVLLLSFGDPWQFQSGLIP